MFDPLPNFVCTVAAVTQSNLPWTSAFLSPGSAFMGLLVAPPNIWYDFDVVPYHIWTGNVSVPAVCVRRVRFILFLGPNRTEKKRNGSWRKRD